MKTRYTEVTLGGANWKMPVTYAVSAKVSRDVGDPMKAAIDISRGAFPWSTEEIINVLHIGVQAAGCPLTRAQVAEAVFENGALHYLKIVADYINALISGDPEQQAHESAAP
jgi:hypothetical protein